MPHLEDRPRAPNPHCILKIGWHGICTLNTRGNAIYYGGIKLNCIKITVSFWVFLLFFINSDTIYPHASLKKEKQEVLQEEVTVTLKLIQVYVTDKKGNAITDLTQEDFELNDNGQDQRITDFEKHSILFPSTQTESQTTERSLSQMMPRKYFFLFDFAFNNMGGVKLAKRIAAHFLETQSLPSDEIGILSYSAVKGLILHEYLTVNHDKVQQVIQRIGSNEIIGRAGRFLEDLESQLRYGQENDMLNPRMAAADREVREGLLRIGGKEQYRHQVLHFCSAMKDFARGMSHIPGIKNIILFSTGVPNWLMYRSGVTPVRPGENFYNIPGSDTFGLRNRYEKMTRELAAANSPMFTVNVEGQDADFMEKEGLSEVSRIVTRKNQPSSHIESRNMRGSTALSNLANDSGGKYFENMNDPMKIAEEIHVITGSYYVLGYYIDEKLDGKYHKLQVKVRQKDCRVYAQNGYFNPKSFSEYDDLEKKIHLIDLALGEKHYFGSPCVFSLEALPVAIQGQSKAILLINSHDQQIRDIAGKETEIVFLVFDERQNLIGHRGIRINDPSFYQKNVFTYVMLPLKEGKFECRAVVRNLETGEGAVASATIFIPETAEHEIILYPPLILIMPGDASYLDIGSKDKIVGKEEYVSLSNVYPYDPALYSPLLKETERGSEKILVLARCRVSDIPGMEMKLFARLLHESTGEKIPLQFSLRTKLPDGTMILFSEIEAGRLRPGKYYLYLYAEEQNMQLKAHTNTYFVIQERPD